MYVARAPAPQRLLNYRTTDASCAATGTSVAGHTEDEVRAIEDGDSTRADPENANRRPARSAAAGPACATIAARTPIAAAADLRRTHLRAGTKRAALPHAAADPAVAALSAAASGERTGG